MNFPTEHKGNILLPPSIETLLDVEFKLDDPPEFETREDAWRQVVDDFERYRLVPLLLESVIWQDKSDLYRSGVAKADQPLMAYPVALYMDLERPDSSYTPDRVHRVIWSRPGGRMYQPLWRVQIINISKLPSDIGDPDGSIFSFVPAPYKFRDPAYNPLAR